MKSLHEHSGRPTKRTSRVSPKVRYWITEARNQAIGWQIYETHLTTLGKERIEAAVLECECIKARIEFRLRNRDALIQAGRML